MMLTEAELAAIRAGYTTPEEYRAKGYRNVAGFLPPDPAVGRLLAHCDALMAALAAERALMDQAAARLNHVYSFRDMPLGMHLPECAVEDGRDCTCQRAQAEAVLAAWRAARQEGG